MEWTWQTWPANGMDLERTLFCGQAFRWSAYDGGFFGVAGHRPLYIEQQGDRLRLQARTADLPFWRSYFQASEEYLAFEKKLLEHEDTAAVMMDSEGIRVLKQDWFEVLITFMISANNNIKRITGIVERLAAQYGQLGVHPFAGEYRTFPAPERLALATEQELRALGTGYRAVSIQQAADRVASGFSLQRLADMPLEEARKTLLTFHGIGPKVADCILLYGYGVGEICPMDVWMKRVLAALYPHISERDALAQFQAKYGKWTGAVQQYYFYHARLEKQRARGARV